MANTKDSTSKGGNRRTSNSRRRADAFIDALTEALETAAAGDGSASVPEPGVSDSRLQRLQGAATDLLGRFHKALAESAAAERLRTLGQQVGDVTAELLATTRQQASSAAEQASAVSDITTTVQELNEVAVQNVEKAEGIIGIAEQSEQISQEGQRDVTAAVEEMDQLRQQVELIATKILDLTERTQQIGEIIASVNEIAEQSKLLALNASIEAARAGEHGRGFSVVAQEIRSLAEQSKQATQQVRSILSEIQKASHSAAMVTEEGSKAATESSAKVRRIGERLGQLVYVINQTTRASRQITAAMKQQSVGLDQIAKTMKQINQATQETKVSIEQAEDGLARLEELTRSDPDARPSEHPPPPQDETLQQ